MTESYPFQKYIDEQKHLDTDEHRHLIKPTVHIIDKDFKGKEHLFCDKSQLCPLGKFKRHEKSVEAERQGYVSVMEMDNADKKTEEDNKKKEVSDLREFTTKQNDVIKKLIEKQDNLESIIKKQNDLLLQITDRLKK